MNSQYSSKLIMSPGSIAIIFILVAVVYPLAGPARAQITVENHNSSTVINNVTTESSSQSGSARSRVDIHTEVNGEVVQDNSWTAESTDGSAQVEVRQEVESHNGTGTASTTVKINGEEVFEEEKEIIEEGKEALEEGKKVEEGKETLSDKSANVVGKKPVLVPPAPVETTQEDVAPAEKAESGICAVDSECQEQDRTELVPAAESGPEPLAVQLAVTEPVTRSWWSGIWQKLNSWWKNIFTYFA